MEAVVARLENVAARLEAAASQMGAEDDGEGTPQYVADYQAIMDNQFAALVKCCTAVKVKKCGSTLKKSLGVANALVAASASCKKPSAEDLSAFLAPAAETIPVFEKLKMKRDKKKTPDRGSYRAALNEVNMLSNWVTMGPPGMLPVAFAQGQLDSAMFHLNRVLKNKTDENKAFVKAAQDFMKAVIDFIKNNFKTGLTFRGKGDLSGAGAASAAEKGAKAAAPKKAKKKKAAVEEKEAEQKDDGSKKGVGTGMGNVFGELSQGLKVTAGLKKVKKEQKTKNRKNRVGKVTMKKKKTSTKKKKKGVMKKLPGTTQILDFGEGVIDVGEEQGGNMRTMIFISGCSDCGIQILCKVKGVQLDNCKNVRISVKDVVSTVEMVNCKSLTVFVTGKVPTVQIDKSESPQIIITKDAKEAPKIICSMVTAGNIELPKPTKEDPDGMIEVPIPEQFVVTASNDGTCKAVPMSH